MIGKSSVDLHIHLQQSILPSSSYNCTATEHISHWRSDLFECYEKAPRLWESSLSQRNVSILFPLACSLSSSKGARAQAYNCPLTFQSATNLIFCGMQEKESHTALTVHYQYQPIYYSTDHQIQCYSSQVPLFFLKFDLYFLNLPLKKKIFLILLLTSLFCVQKRSKSVLKDYPIKFQLIVPIYQDYRVLNCILQKICMQSSPSLYCLTI